MSGNFLQYNKMHKVRLVYTAKVSVTKVHSLINRYFKTIATLKFFDQSC